MTRRRLPKAERRATILAAADTHFLARAYADVVIPDLASDAGASQALVFHHFSTKAGLFAALIDAHLTDLHATRTDALATCSPGEPLHHRIYVLLDAHLAALAADPLLLPGAGEPAEAHEVRARGDRHLAEQLRAEIGIGDFARHRWAVIGIVGFLTRAAMVWRDGGFNENERRPLVEAALGALEGGLGDWRV